MKNTLYINIAASLVALLPASQCLAQSVPINPAKTSSVDDPGRIPYQFNAQGNTSNTPPVPLNKRLVVEHVSVVGQLCPAAGGPALALAATQGPGMNFGGPPPTTNPPPCSATFVLVTVFAVSSVINSGVPFSSILPPLTPFGGFAFDQPTLGFVDVGGHVTVAINSNASVAFNFVVTGYLLDCTVNQCAPILP